MDEMTGRSAMAATGGSSLVSSSIFSNYPILCASIAFAIAQFIKFLTALYKKRRWDLKQLVSSDGKTSPAELLKQALSASESYGHFLQWLFMFHIVIGSEV
ncbi:hypothetical protein L484_007566 [Morus notabilis]|uniref:Uncharacterized protein n=1 Tax=Morus notabilis TaxID=981085 RepID=W9R8M1_9ROSA|nr:hypothetical protein L484_007566 [Morus notabilis]